jgi:hypothetical protein
MRVAVVLDCLQPDRLAQFWASALGYRRAPSGGPYVVLVPDRPPGPERGLQRRLLRGPTAGARARRRPSGWPPSTPQWSTCSSGTSTWRGAEAGERRFATGASGFWRAHVHALLAASGEPAASSSAQKPCSASK